MRKLLALLALLVLSVPAAEAQSSGGGWIVYRPSPSVIQSLQVIGGTITCGSTTATCVVTFPLTATGGADVAASFQASADLSSADTLLRIGDAGSATLFVVTGIGALTTAQTVTSGGSVLAQQASSVGWSGRALWQSPGDGSFIGMNGGTTNYTIYINDTAKTLTESSATDVWLVNVATETAAGGSFDYSILAQDAADVQMRRGTVEWTAINDAGTEACVLGTPVEVDNTPTGTLTVTVTCVTTPTNGVLLQLNAVSSLTQTTLNVKSRITKDHGTGTMVAQ